jgi:hypothetical protein
MCLVVYSGSPAPLPLVPWTESAPAFNVRTLAPHEEAVRRVLSHPHLATLGAHTGCGCGFLMDGAEVPADVTRSRAALARYATEALRNGPMELYVCWNGDEDAPGEHELTLATNELLERDDWLQERTHVRLVATAD